MLEREVQSFGDLCFESTIIEQRLHALFKDAGFCVVDRSNDPIFMQKDIDFDISKGEYKATLEVKSDKQMHRTGNVFVELNHERPTKGSVPGWHYYCEADYICYCDTVKKIVYILDWAKLKPLVLQLGRQTTFNNPHDIGTVTIGRLISISELQRNACIYQTITL